MGYNQETVTYLNGDTPLNEFERVFDVAGQLRLASASELENGIVLKRIPANVPAAVQPLENGQHYTVIAADAFSKDSVVYRAANGRVASTGSSVFGRAMSASGGAGEIVTVLYVAGGGGGGSSDGGGITVRHADGTSELFIASAATRAARGEALVAAAAALQTQAAVGLPGSTLYLEPDTDYEVTDLTITSKHGISIIGNNNTIWNVPGVAYDHILRFTTCNDVTLKGVKVQGDGELSNPSDPSTVTNTGDGTGILFHTCARPKIRDCESGGTTGGPQAPYPYNGNAHGLWFITCTDIDVNGFDSSYAGCWGLATTGSSSRITIKNCFIYNARARSMQLTPGVANPFIDVCDCVLMSDETVNTLSIDTDWFNYLPFIDAGNTGAVVDTLNLTNVNHYWLNPSASQTASGAGYPVLKVQDIANVRMTNCTLWHGAAFSPGTGSPYTTSIIVQNSSVPCNFHMTNVYLSLDMRNIDYLGSYQPVHIYATQCDFGMDQTHSLTFYNFHGTGRFHKCTFQGFISGVFDFNRDAAGYLEAIGCKFTGTAETQNVVFGTSVPNTNPIGDWAGDYLFADNDYVLCRPAATADDRLVLNQATRDRNVLVWDDTLAGNFAHPAPGTSPNVFASVGGRQGMRVKNKNYSPNLTSTWAAEYAWWSTGTGSYQDS